MGILKARLGTILLAPCILSGALRAQSPGTPVRSEAQTCRDLTLSKQESWSISSAEFEQPPFTIGSGTEATTVKEVFCRVSGIAKPSARSEIRFEVWLPPKTNWNGKLAGVGSGGSFGLIGYSSLSRALSRKYATVATDNGHRSENSHDVSWALRQPERIIDFGYRTEHAVTKAAKILTREFYGKAPAHSYFIGCSQGGHHGLAEAQRFPDDYDGIIAGAPVYNWTDEMADQAWNVRALRETLQGAFSIEKLETLHQAVVRACGGIDGLIDDPRQCSFDPGTLVCKGADSSFCLSTKEVEAVAMFYQGPRTSQGVQIYPGLSLGSESDWGRLWSNPKHLGGSWEGFYRFMVFDDPSWDLSALSFDRDPKFAKQKLGAILDPDNPDLTAFAGRGGRLIVYHGWADDMVPSQVSIDYRTSVENKMGKTHVHDFYRLLMVPGMAHCGGGPGASILFHSERAEDVPMDPERDLLTALEQWVELGRIPDDFIASRVNEKGELERTRLVCAYPTHAKYRGSGDPMRAESYMCSTK